MERIFRNRTNSFFIIFCLLLFIIPFSYTKAELPVSVSSSVSKALVKRGEEIILKVKVKVLTKSSITPTIMSLESEKIGLKVVDFGDEKPRTVDEETIYERWYKLIPDFTGSYIIPSTKVVYFDKSKNENKEVATSEIFVEVSDEDGKVAAQQTPNSRSNTQSAKADDKNRPIEERLSDLKDIEEIPFTLGTKSKIVLAFVFTVLFLSLIYWWYRKRKKSDAHFQSLISPYEKATSLLHKLKDEIDQVDSLKNEKYFCFTLSEILREYLESEFHFPGTDRTTDEIKSNLESTLFSKYGERVSMDHQVLRKELITLLEQCDLIKFTDSKMSKESLATLLSSALDWLQLTKVKEILPNSKTNSNSNNSDNEESVI